MQLSKYWLMLCLVCLVAQSCLTLRPHGLQLTRLLCQWGFSKQEYWSGLPCPPLGDVPNSGIKPGSPHCGLDSLPSEPPEKPKNPGVGSLSLLHGVFSTQESNQGLLRCRRILYQLHYQGSPGIGQMRSVQFKVAIPYQACVSSVITTVKSESVSCSVMSDSL